LFRDAYQLFALKKAIFSPVLPELIDDGGAYDLSDIRAWACDRFFVADELPNPHLDFLQDVFWVETVFRKIVSLDLNTHVLAIVMEHPPELFFREARSIHLDGLTPAVPKIIILLI
jgi:hypothetical protein